MIFNIPKMVQSCLLPPALHMNGLFHPLPVMDLSVLCLALKLMLFAYGAVTKGAAWELAMTFDPFRGSV